MYNACQIENIAAGELLKQLSKIKYIKPYISNNDKSISWDGKIELFGKNDVHFSKDNYINSCPIQVKGTEKFNHTISKFPMKISDLCNYAKEGKTLLFVIDVISEEIFYRALLPGDVKGILKDCNEGQKEKSIEVYPFSEIKDVFPLFLTKLFYEAELQRPIRNISIDTAKISCVNVGGNVFFSTIISGTSLEDLHLNERETSLYQQVGSSVEYIKTINLKTLPLLQRKINIKAGSKESIVDLSYVVNNDAQGNFFKINEQIKIYIRDERITFTPIGELKQLAQSLEIVISLFKGNTIDCQYFNFKGKRNTEELKKLKDFLETINKEVKILDVLSVKRELFYEQLEEEDHQRLCTLYTEIIKKGKHAVAPNKSSRITGVTVAGLNLLLVASVEESKEQYQDFFTKKTIIEFLGDKKRYPAFLKVSANDIARMDNIPIDKLFPMIKKVKFTKSNIWLLQEFFYKCLEAYDMSKRQGLFDLLLSVANVIKDTLNTFESILDYYQVIRRERKLSGDEANELELNITAKDSGLMAAKGLVLGQNQRFEAYFSQLSDEEKVIFKNYPIYKLLEYNKSLN